MKKILLYIGSLCLLINNVFAQEVSYAPKISSFALNPDNMGAIGNSVNLFTGDVNLPLNLVSMPGRNGLGTSVGIFYNSNVQNVVGTWNLEAPTGILGLGWSMPVSQIIVDHKSTGARDDDDFYLVDGGSSNRLIRIGSEDSAKTYSLKNYRFWKIKYYPNRERWEVTKEDGLIYVYGDNTSGRKTVQYLVKWGNWIGNSAVTTGQSRQANVWDISEVVNSYNEKIKYTYDIVEETVEKTLNSGGLKYTKASYLEYITDQFNRQIKFIYSEKSSDEYQDPHVEKEEPDAYQERIETRYLSSIEIKNENSANLFSIEFKYDDSYGTGNLKKRLLTEIIQKNKNGNSLPSLKFVYNKSGNNIGALQAINYPSGGSVTYNYTMTNLGKSKRDLTVTAPEGYSQPIYYLQEDYILIIWRIHRVIQNTDWYDGKIQIYQWDGEWVKNPTDYDIPRLQLKYYENNFGCTFQKDFFAFITDSKSDPNITGFPVYIFSKDETKQGIWKKYETYITRGASTTPYLVSGKGFVGLKYHVYPNGHLNLYMHENNDWTPYINKISIMENDKNNGGDYRDASTAASNNVLSINDVIHTPQSLSFFHLDELKEWKTDTSFSLGTERLNNNYWHPSNSFLVGILGGSPERVFWWDENYSNFQSQEVTATYENSSVPIFNNSTFGLHYKNNENSLIYSYAFDGEKWNSIDASVNFGTSNYFGFGVDYLIRQRFYTNTDKFFILSTYNPNNSTWSSNSLQSPSSATHRSMAGNNYFIYNDYLYYKSANGTWESVLYIPTIDGSAWDQIEDTQMGFGANYFAYGHTNTASYNPKMIIFKNGTKSSASPISLSGYLYRYNYSSNSMISFTPQDNATTNTVYIYRVINDNCKGKIIDYPVSYIRVNDGKSNISYTNFVYSADSAKIDPSGQVAQYSKVRVIQNDLVSQTDRKFGYTETYFFNGGKPESALSQFPNDPSRSNAQNYYSLLIGMPYESRVYDKDLNLLSWSKDYWYVNTVAANKENAYYPTKLKTIAYSEGIYDSTIYVYNSQNGMVQKTIHRCDVQTDVGKRDFISEVKYAFEQYSGMKTKNMLAQVYQTKTFEAANGVAQGAAISDAITEYDATTGMPTLSKTWDGSAYITTSQITRDTKGNVIQVYNPVDGVYSSTIWGHGSKLPIASVSNAQSSEVKIENCETFKSGDIAENLTLYANNGGLSVGWSTNAVSGKSQRITARLIGAGVALSLTPPVSREYIVELDYYIESGAFSVNLNTTSLGTLNSIDAWKHIRYKTTSLTKDVLSSIRFISTIDNSVFYLDNIRVYPADAYCSSVTYDPVTFQKIAGMDENGITSTAEYDEYDAPIRQRNWKKQIVSEQNSYLSKSWNTTYNSADPNYSISASFPNGNYVKNWSFEEDHVNKVPVNWSTAGQPTSIVTDGKFGRRAVKIVCDTNTNSSIAQYLGQFEGGKTLTVSVWFKADVNTYGQVFLGDDGGPDAYDNCVGTRKKGNGDWQRMSVSLTLKHNDRVSVYIYGDKDGKVQGHYVIYDGIMVEEGSVPSDPIVNIAYTNGIGQTIQTQSIENNKRHVTAVDYDAMGRDNIAWKTFPQNGSMGFVDHYADSCRKYNPTASSRPYVQKEFYPDPLSRIKRTIPVDPTSDFGEAAITSYGSNAAEFLKYVKTEGKIGPDESTITSYTYYDKLGREVKSVVGDRTATTAYNKQGKAVKITDPMNLNTTMTYDYLGRLKSKTTPDVGLTEYLYDKAGRLRAMLEPEGRKTNMYNVLYWKYDKLGRVIEKGYTQYVSTAWSTSVQSEINSSSNWPAAPTAWRKKYTYGDALAVNAYGRLLKIQVNSDTDTDAELEETFAYDESGQTLSKTMKSVSYGSKTYVTNYAYDALSRTAKIYYPTSETVNLADITVDNQTFASGTASYNSYGVISSANTTINSGASITFTAGKNIRLKPGFKASSGSSFKAKIADPIIYTYDQRGNTKYIGVADDIDYYASYEYNSDGSMKTESLNNKQNPILTNYTYDSKGRLTGMAGSKFSENIGYSTGDYTQKSFYSLIGTSMCSYTIGASAMISQYEYDYDNYGRLVSAYVSQNSPKNIGVGSGKATTYDKNDKITSLTKNTTTYPYNYYSSSNKLQNTDGSGDDYGYDYNGNLTAAAPRNLTTTYDIFTQMPMSQTVGSTTLNFEYDANNERTYMLSGTVKQLYLRGLGEYPLVTLENTSGVEKTTQYIYGPTGLIFVKNSSGNYYIRKDHLGSVRVVQYEGSSEIASYYDYSPYGEILSYGGNVANPYKFTGQEFDDETGLFNFRARLYDPALGIFYGVDPAGQGYSPYGYAGNNPVKFVDRDGRFFMEAFAIIKTVAEIYSYANAAYNVYQGYKNGGLGGALFSLGVSAASSYAFGGLAPNTSSALSYVGSEMIRSSMSSSVTALFTGGNVGNSMAFGAASGLVSSGLGALAHLEKHSWKWYDPKDDIEWARRASRGGVPGCPPPPPQDPTDYLGYLEEEWSGLMNSAYDFGKGIWDKTMNQMTQSGTIIRKGSGNATTLADAAEKTAESHGANALKGMGKVTEKVTWFSNGVQIIYNGEVRPSNAISIASTLLARRWPVPVLIYNIFDASTGVLSGQTFSEHIDTWSGF